jgi:protein-L-isoaspartate(D-aspartate) O-methyltransferase
MTEEPAGERATWPPGAGSDTAGTRAARAALVDGIARREPGISERTLAALRAVPRHLFLPPESIAQAYEDHAQPIGEGQTISQPTVVAIMTDALQLVGDETILEVGTGSGYQAAVLSRLAARVWSVELVAALATLAAARLATLGCDNVAVRQGDGHAGWPEHAPFDRIVLTAAPPALPQELVAQLRDGGVLVAPLGTAEQDLYRFTLAGGYLTRTHLCPVRFVPMIASAP